jgi:HEAT repeats
MRVVRIWFFTHPEEARLAKARPHAVARMTALSLVLTAGTASAASLRNLPTEVLCELIDDAEVEAGPERARLLSVLTADDRASVRAQVAEAMGSLWPGPVTGATDELRRLARDTSDHVRVSAAVGLARAIERASAPERIDLVCTWALSPDTDERLALARALTWSTPVFVADLVLEQLASDESTAVRAAALAAVAKHFHENSTVYASIVGRCLDDADANVQRLARALFKRARG